MQLRGEEQYENKRITLDGNIPCRVHANGRSPGNCIRGEGDNRSGGDDPAGLPDGR